MTFALGGSAIAGVVQPIAPAISAEVGVDDRAWRVALGALWLPPLEFDVDPGSVRVSLWAGTLRGCAALLPGAMRLEVCTGLHAGALHGEARGYSRNEEADEFVLAWPIEVAWSLVPAPIGFELTAGVLVPLVRQEFAIDNVGVAYETWPVGLSAGARVVAGWEL